MAKAKTLDRIELTRQKMRLKEQLNTHETQETHEAHEFTKENSPFLKMREQLQRDNPQEYQDANTCQFCGGELVRYEGCYRCKKCGWSKC